MKIVVGVVLAGALAGALAVVNSVGTRHAVPLQSPPAAPAPKGKPVREHFAYTNTGGYLDGPRREAVMGRRGCIGDAEDNIYAMTSHSYSLRVARQDGMAETLTGDDHWVPSLDAEEGPASCLTYIKSTGSQGGVAMNAYAARGAPLAGPDKGAIYLSTGPTSHHPDWYYKVWRNQEKGGRWWFKHVIGGGAANPPTVAGQSAPALGVKLNAGVTVGVDGKLYLTSTGTRFFYLNLYRYDEEKNELTCVLAETDYKEKTGGANCIWPASDGGFYIWCNSGEGNKLAYKVSADRSKVEKLIHGYGYNAGNRVFDGPALKSGWFDGPQPVAYFPPDILFGTAVDDAFVRRCKDGRISTLCYDGEWREFPSNPRDSSPAKDTNATEWGRGWVLGKNSIYEFYLCSTGSSAIYKMSPIDFAKPAIGPQAEGTLKGGK